MDVKAIALQRFASLYMLADTPKGRGVLAGERIPAGTIIDTCPVLILGREENSQHIEMTSLFHYTYNWPIGGSNGKPARTQAVVLGLGSMFNHSASDQNVGWQRDLCNELVIYRALRDIQRGEELCISYGDHLTFVDADKPNVIDIVESGQDVLNRIQLDS